MRGGGPNLNDPEFCGLLRKLGFVASHKGGYDPDHQTEYFHKDYGEGGLGMTKGQIQIRNPQTHPNPVLVQFPCYKWETSLTEADLAQIRKAVVTTQQMQIDLVCLSDYLGQ